MHFKVCKGKGHPQIVYLSDGKEDNISYECPVCEYKSRYEYNSDEIIQLKKEIKDLKEANSLLKSIKIKKEK